jgi:purine-binding chemotaxis protein CheW
VAERQKFATFLVDDCLFGIEVEKVQEVASLAEITRVPLAPAVVRGLISLRGQIVTSIDLRRCLRLSERPEHEVPVNLILYTDDGCASLLVDQVGDVLEIDEATFEFPPETLQRRHRKLIRGTYKLAGRLLLVLDTEAVLNGIADIAPAQPAGVYAGEPMS